MVINGWLEKKLSPQEALSRLSVGKKVYMAIYEGEVWGAGQINEFGDLIGYFATKKDAREACREVKESKSIFEATLVRTSFEEIDESYLDCESYIV